MLTRRISLIYAILLGSCSALFIHGFVFAAGILFSSGIYGNAHIPGVWNSQPGGGNGGLITLITQDQEPDVNGSGVYIDTDDTPPKITGNIFIETVGWARFIDTEIRDDLSVSGNLWSNNAGYIELDARSSSYSGVYYLPGTQAFTGYAWSATLGYISFGSGINTVFKNMVKVIGTIGGKKVFDTDYKVGTKFVVFNSAKAIDAIRKNVSLLTRSIPEDKMNTANNTTKKLNNVLYYRGNDINNLNITAPHSKMDITNSRTLIIIGGDLTIDNDIVVDSAIDAPRAIIVLKSTSGLGGNVYISPNVKNIYTSLIVEGSIYSGIPGNLTNDNTTKILSLPPSQLYIYGGVYSKNTIGGAAIGICPFTEGACNEQNKYKYDWNYFRSYDKSPGNMSDKAGYKDFSVIIEFDPRLYENPPPGMTPP